MKHRTSHRVILLLVFLVIPFQIQAEFRKFRSSDGKIMVAKLIHHKNGQVTLQREDGKKFSVTPTIFDLDDQLYIRDWMQKTPASVEYRLEIDATKKKIGGERVNLGYKRVKNEQWAYEITVTNLSRDTVSNLTIHYKVFNSNRAEGEYSAYEVGGLMMTKGKATLNQDLEYNRSMVFLTKPVDIDSVDYDGMGSRYKDQLLGCMVRVVNSDGNIVKDWVLNTNTLAGRTWENTEPKAERPSEAIRIE